MAVDNDTLTVTALAMLALALYLNGRRTDPRPRATVRVLAMAALRWPPVFALFLTRKGRAGAHLMLGFTEVGFALTAEAKAVPTPEARQTPSS